MQRHVDDAVAQGAQVLLGGARLPGAGSFFAPTVLSEVPTSALVNTEAPFGPLAALTRFETEEEVIRLANDAPVGLAGYFFSKDAARVWRVAEALEVGMVGSNTGLISQAAIPFVGIKESGLGELLFSSVLAGWFAGCAKGGVVVTDCGLLISSHSCVRAQVARAGMGSRST